MVLGNGEGNENRGGPYRSVESTFASHFVVALCRRTHGQHVVPDTFVSDRQPPCGHTPVDKPVQIDARQRSRPDPGKRGGSPPVFNGGQK